MFRVPRTVAASRPRRSWSFSTWSASRSMATAYTSRATRWAPAHARWRRRCSAPRSGCRRGVLQMDPSQQWNLTEGSWKTIFLFGQEGKLCWSSPSFADFPRRITRSQTRVGCEVCGGLCQWLSAYNTPQTNIYIQKSTLLACLHLGGLVSKENCPPLWWLRVFAPWVRFRIGAPPQTKRVEDPGSNQKASNHPLGWAVINRSSYHKGFSCGLHSVNMPSLIFTREGYAGLTISPTRRSTSVTDNCPTSLPLGKEANLTIAHGSYDRWFTLRAAGSQHLCGPGCRPGKPS